MSDRIYCYPGIDVLINKYDIRDAETLNATERFRTQLRYAQLQANPIKGDFDVAHIKAVHYHLFQDMYTWAGQFRTLNISKSTDFCRYPYIVGRDARNGISFNIAKCSTGRIGFHRRGGGSVTP